MQFTGKEDPELEPVPDDDEELKELYELDELEDPDEPVPERLGSAIGVKLAVNVGSVTAELFEL